MTTKTINGVKLTPSQIYMVRRAEYRPVPRCFCVQASNRTQVRTLEALEALGIANRPHPQSRWASLTDSGYRIMTEIVRHRGD